MLQEISRRRVRNTVWLTADVHYSAAIHYAPEAGRVRGGFDPFWEFIAGPLNAGAFGPNALDPTFGPRQAGFVSAPPRGENTFPLEGFQHFGEVNVDGATGQLRVDLRDATGRVAVVEEAAPAGPLTRGRLRCTRTDTPTAHYQGETPS